MIYGESILFVYVEIPLDKSLSSEICWNNTVKNRDGRL